MNERNGNRKGSGMSMVIFGVIIALLVVPVLMKCPVIKGIVLWWLDFADSTEYKVAYLEAVFGMIGVYLSVLGALQTEEYFRKKEKNKEIEESSRLLYGELRKCFGILQEIFRRTSVLYGIEDDGPNFVEPFCETARSYRLDLDSQWSVHLTRLNGKIGAYEYGELEKYFKRLSAIDCILESGDLEVIRSIYVPYIRGFITKGGEGIYDAAANILTALEKNFSDD